MDINVLCCILLSILFGADGIMWHLNPNTQKCLREELQAQVLVTGEYEVSDAVGQRVDYVVSSTGLCDSSKSLAHLCSNLSNLNWLVTNARQYLLSFVRMLQVKDSKGHILSKKEDISKGKFSFATETFDTFEICFTSIVSPQHRGQKQEVSLITKRGAEAKNYEAVSSLHLLKPE